MKHEIDQLLIRCNSYDIDISRDASLRIGFLLENSRFPGESPQRSLYAEYLSAELLAEKLSIDEQRSIVQSLTNGIILDTTPDKSSLIWAIGKATPIAVIGSLLFIVNNHADSLDSLSLYQLINLIQLSLKYDERHRPISEIASHIQESDPSKVIEKYVKSNDSSVSEIAEMALESITNYKNSIKSN